MAEYDGIDDSAIRRRAELGFVPRGVDPETLRQFEEKPRTPNERSKMRADEVRRTPAERAKILIDALPETVRIGSHDYALVRMPALETSSKNRWGECSHIEATIRISEAFPTPTKLIETFLHEMLHGLWFTHSVYDEDREEQTCDKVAKGLTCLFRDNPWLAGWIAGALK
jgi:hypothetical protein